LSTFAKIKKEAAAEDAMVSYHEIAKEVDVIDSDDTIPDDSDSIPNDSDTTIDNTTGMYTKDDDSTADSHVTFSATVMASVIAEALADADEDQFVGASFAQLQEVDDVYEDDEPDLVCCEHVVDLEDDKGVDVPDFVIDANISAEEPNQKIRVRNTTVTKHSDFLKDFELMVYHTAQRVMYKSSRPVGIFHYVPGRPGLISHTYEPNVKV
jgi:hypothetical protein